MKQQPSNRKAPATLKDRSKPLPTDPDELNADRARWAAAALAEFRRQTGADLEDAVSDLLADLMHWCDRHGQTFGDELRRARGHYEAETTVSLEPTAPKTVEL
jgi:hypothetical protein